MSTEKAPVAITGHGLAGIGGAFAVRCVVAALAGRSC
jgi:hypothetical protein